MRPQTILGWCLSLSCAATAGELRVSVSDAQGAPVANAVVSVQLLEPADAISRSTPTGEEMTAVIAQKNEQFEPFVSVIQTGTAVSFPNQDDILHNVYSFSQAKTFKLPLYGDKAPPPVFFDEPGTVILGCNIHDWMVAYVYVLDTPHFAKTASDGAVELTALAAGSYRVNVFHPRKRKRGSTPAQSLTVPQEGHRRAAFVIPLKPEWRPKRRAEPGSGS